MKDLEVASLGLEAVANLDASIACEELDELKKGILGSESQQGLRNIGLTDDFPVPVTPITLLGGK